MSISTTIITTQENFLVFILSNIFVRLLFENYDHRTEMWNLLFIIIFHSFFFLVDSYRLFCCCCCCCFFLHLCYYKSFLPYNPTEKDWFTEIILFRLQYSHFFFSTLCTLVCFMWLSIYQFQNDFALFQLNPCNICIYQTTCIETNSNVNIFVC